MAPTRLLVIDDDVPFCRLLSKSLARLGFSPHFASLLESGLQRLQSEDFDVILLDPQRAGMHLPHDWTAVRDVAPQTAVVIATRPVTISMAVACMRLGATDFLQKPLTAVSHAASRMHAAAATSTRPRLRACRPAQPDEHGILTASPLFLDLLDRADRLADSDLPVLIEGESGTGKDLIARRMHARSPRKDGPWVPVNCAALPDSLADAELFGHTRDAFTGAEDCSATPTAAPSSSTRWGSCPPVRRRDCCAPCKREKSDPWASPAARRSTCACWRLRTGTSGRPSAPEPFARTCIIDSLPAS
jgi:two-component system NtrC family response regulator/two-component system response regulator AtoC